ncbi:hypothetical protein C4K26_5039 [Pseudomonas chlororaphis]|nr:hypothetical protein C4K26_5039 [Pseudomonas chlororaphis]
MPSEKTCAGYTDQLVLCLLLILCVALALGHLYRPAQCAYRSTA